MDEPIVRGFEARDLDRVHAIYAHEVEHGSASWSDEPPTKSELQAKVDATLANGHPFLVAELEEQVVGYAYASQFRPRTGYRYTLEDSVYVAPEAQRRGVARALLTELIELCTASGATQMIAGISATTSAGSVALHASLGFREVGRLPAVGCKFGHWHDLIFMQRALGAGADEPPR